MSPSRPHSTHINCCLLNFVLIHKAENFILIKVGKILSLCFINHLQNINKFIFYPGSIEKKMSVRNVLITVALPFLTIVLDQQLYNFITALESRITKTLSLVNI